MIDFRYIILAIVLFYFSPVQAGFTRSGNVITQTGTDTDLQDLANINVVDVSSQNGIDVYNIGNRRLVIQGNLTIDPEKEMLIVGYWNGELMVVENSGHLTIGNEIVKNGVTRYSSGTAIFFEDCPLGFNDRISFEDNSSFTWNGGVISVYAGKFGFYGNGVTVRINSENAILIYRTEDEQNQIRQETDDFISTAFTFINGDLTVVGTGQQLNGYKPVHCSGAISFSNATPNQDVILRGYAGGDQGNTIDVKLWQGSRPILVNSLTGSDLNCGPHIPGGTAYGVALVYQEFGLKAQTLSGTPVNEVSYYIIDNDNGNRETYSREGHTVNNNQDFVYSETTNAAGETPLVDILLAANVAQNGGSNINSGSFAWDYRGKNNDATDLFDVNVWSYDHTYTLLSDVELKGTEPIVEEVSLIDDTFITNSKTDAQAIAGITITHSPTNNTGTITISEEITLCELYDFVKLNKLSHLEEPTPQTLVTTPNGGTLDVGDYEMVLQAGAVLRPCEKFQKINSNVPANINNPSQNLEVALTDPNGTYKLIRLSGLDSADVVITDETTSTQLLQANNQTGELNFVTQSASTDLSVLVTRSGYTNWAANLDLTTEDIFNLFVSQAELVGSVGNPATLENQEDIIYLSRKLLQKSEAINSKLKNETFPTVNVNSVNQTTTDPTSEKQDEVLELLRRVLLKVTSSNEKLEE